MIGEQVVITGGAGFIGSHLAERLIAEDYSVSNVDDLSTGNRDWVPEDADLFDRDLRNSEALDDVLSSNVNYVFHLAASKAVNTDHPREQFEKNTEMMYNVLEAVSRHEIRNVVYTSSSAVYDEAPRPTPEDFAPLEPINVYGASKLSGSKKPVAATDSDSNTSPTGIGIPSNACMKNSNAELTSSPPTSETSSQQPLKPGCSHKHSVRIN